MGQHVKSKKLQGNSAGRSVLERLHKLYLEGATETFGLKEERGKWCLLLKKEKRKWGKVYGVGTVKGKDLLL